MNTFKLLATSLVLYFGLSVTTVLADSDTHTFSYEMKGASFSASYKDGEITKLVRNKKVVYRSDRKSRLGSLKRQINGLSSDIESLVSMGESDSSGQRKSLEEEIKTKMYKITLKLSRR